MSAHVQHVKQVGGAGRMARPAWIEDDEEYADEAYGTRASIAARIVWYVAGVILVLLAFRFVLTLLGANASNPFANIIYNASHPFVTPFFSLFDYNFQYGVSRFESFTLVAMLVYAVIAWGLARLFTIRRDAKIDSRYV